MSRTKLVIIDGSSLIYRAFFALPPLTTADGTPTNAVYGFTAMLIKLLEEEKPDILLMALEGGRTFRHAEFADYKAHRPRTPDDLAVQTPIARAMAGAFRIPILQYPGYEADDVIGTVTCRGRDAGHDVLVVTGDLDELQLINDQVKVLVTSRGVTDTKTYDEEAVKERYGLPPALLPDFKALKGDSSDNIPGIAGIGDKTGAELLSRFGSLEALLDRAGEVTAPRIRTNLLEGRENAILYKRLATIVTDLPLDLHFDDWAYLGPDLPRARDLCERLEFRTLARRIPQPQKPEATPPVLESAREVSWRKVEEPEELEAWIERARLAGGVAIRSLVAGPRVRGTLLGMALCSAGETIFLGTEGESGDGLLAGAVDDWSVPAPLRLLLEDPAVELLAHDLKREYHALSAQEVRPARPAFDTLLAAYVLNPGRSNYRLDDLVREHLGRSMEIPAGPEGAARTAAAVWDLREPMTLRLRDDELDRVYVELELPLVPILARIEDVGVAVNGAELRELSVRLAALIADIEARAYTEAKHPFNLGSPKQLQDILFTELALPSGRKTKTGHSTDSDVLQDLAVVHPLPALILEWRELAKLKSTYADALQGLVDARDGRIHTNLNQAVAATGRLSSSDPNLQNIPIRTEVGREIRCAFVPAPGMRLMAADYSQIELRIAAHVCRDPELVRAFQEDRDVHAATAARVYGVALSEVTPDQRRNAKTVNFAVLYGQREFGLSRQLRISVGDARELIAAYFAEFPGMLEYAQTTLNGARRDGFVTTLPPFCRKRYIPGIHAGNRNERLAAEREAVNAPIQGTAADIIKAAMIRVDAAMRAGELRSRMILQVHDELLFEIVPGEESEMSRLVCREMEAACNLHVPLKVDVKSGCNWRDVQSSGLGDLEVEMLAL